VATWIEFAEAAPEMAERGFRQLSIPLAYLATVRKDGAPRLHPLSPIFAGGRLFVAIQATSPRRHDLARDGRYSLHALPPELDEYYDEFEFNVTGRAVLVTDPITRAMVSDAEAVRSRPALKDNDWLFELHIESALTAVWNHKMEKQGDQWLPTLAEEPRATRQTWKEA
jgi:Pyridoxamine 5'-phosphate oxidase